MTKLTLLSFSIYFSKNYQTQFINLLMIIMILISTPPILSIYNKLFMFDNLSSILMLLTTMSTMLILLSSSIQKKIFHTIIPIFLILLMTFLSHKTLLFYILFELVLIPTTILITSLGNQPERLQAGIYLMMYTITASLPLLVSIIFMKTNSSFTLNNTLFYLFPNPLFITLAFMTKLPMFLLHLWLPKAHVEAPLEGSMILAAILLKLGGYGLIRFLPLTINKLNQMSPWIISISLIGASATSMNCIRQKDLKSLIAYSSVAHMAMVLASIMTMNIIGMKGTIMMMIAHGFSSSALFFLVNDLYTKFHTRNITLLKGILSMSPNITFWWFMFMAVNMSTPPSINTISEIFIMSSMMFWNKSTILMIILLSFFTSSFSILMYTNITHNKSSFLKFQPTPSKSFLSLFTHLSPLILLLSKMEIM